MQFEVGQYSLSFIPIISCHYDNYRKFNCGNGSINGFLKTDAFLSHVYKESSTTLVFNDSQLIGYFTIKKIKVKFEINRQIEEVDCLEIARIGVDLSWQNKGIGEILVSHIIDLAYMFNERYVVGFAIREKVDWYRTKFNFRLVSEEEYENDSGEPVIFIYLNLEYPEILEQFETDP